MEGIEIDTKDEAVKSQIAIRCAKAAILLSSLKQFPNHHLETATIDDEEEGKEMMKKSIGSLKVELARERMKRKKMKLCGLMEVLLQNLAMMSSYISITQYILDAHLLLVKRFRRTRARIFSDPEKDKRIRSQVINS
ncbi:hypothetical protein CFOL_v3_07084, partial [Cephalotus follicularis]